MKASNNDTSSYQVQNEVYVNLTKLLKKQDREDHIKNWIDDLSTIEFLGFWETVHNPAFQKLSFENLRKKTSKDSFLLTLPKWVAATRAIGIIAKTGQKDDIYAHPDIALHFCTWLNPLFKLLVLKEFQQLKALNKSHTEWNLNNYLNKVNSKLQLGTSQPILAPIQILPKDQEVTSLKEIDVPYYAMFGFTPSTWEAKNAKLVAQGWHLRDAMSAQQLIVLANLEKLNSAMYHTGNELKKRLKLLNKTALVQLKALENSASKKHSAVQKTHSPEKKEAGFDKYLEALLNVPPMNK